MEQFLGFKPGSPGVFAGGAHPVSDARGPVAWPGRNCFFVTRAGESPRLPRSYTFVIFTVTETAAPFTVTVPRLGLLPHPDTVPIE